MRSFILMTAILVWTQYAEAQLAEFNDRGVTFGHVHLVVADVQLHKDLWPDLFGADLVEKEGFSAVRVSNALIFFREGEPTAPSVETAIEHFGLKVRDLSSVLSKWRTLGYEIDSQTIDDSGASITQITMPGGVRLALAEEPDQAASTSMGHIQIAAPNRDVMDTWYDEHFGFAPVHPGDSSHSASIPGSELRFRETTADKLPTDGASIDHIGFEIQRWDAFVESLRESDIQFEFGPVHIESLDLWVAFFNDPGGVLVEITHGLDQF